MTFLRPATFDLSAAPRLNPPPPPSPPMPPAGAPPNEGGAEPKGTGVVEPKFVGVGVDPPNMFGVVRGALTPPKGPPAAGAPPKGF